MHNRFLVVAALLALSACVKERDITIGEGEGEGEGSGCLTATLAPVTFGFQDDVSTHYQAQLTSDLDTGSPDYLVLQFFNYNERIGELGAGTFALDLAPNDNYGGCAECLLVFTDQLDPNAQPARTFFQSAGTITLERNPREGADLFGRIEGLVLVESTIGGEALESAPVEGGDCLEIGDVELALKFSPPGWTCDAALYNARDGVCDCACGEPDPDCFANDTGTPPPTTTVGCAANEVCTFEGCRATCDAWAGTACPDPNDVCTFADPVDVCADDTTRDPAGLGQPCTDDSFRMWCAVTGTIPAGVCDYDLDGDGVRTCHPRCATDADCAQGEVCNRVVYGGDDARGFCDVPL